MAGEGKEAAMEGRRRRNLHYGGGGRDWGKHFIRIRNNCGGNNAFLTSRYGNHILLQLLPISLSIFVFSE